MDINPQDQAEFAQTPEAMEYITKLQQGRAQLPPDASPLEHEAFKTLAGIVIKSGYRTERHILKVVDANERDSKRQ